MNGWKLVPIEPTGEMLSAAADVPDDWPQQHWEAMLTAAPVPPAGDVEVQRYDMSGFGDGMVEMADGALVYFDDHHAHITRLTAERDGLLTQCAGIYQQLEICQKQRDHRQSELTKALELLMRLRNCKWIPTAEWQHEVSDVLARQSAPAANGVSDE